MFAYHGFYPTKNHSIMAYNATGDLVTWGKGRLGRYSGTAENTRTPKPIKLLAPIVAASNSEHHTLLIDALGNLYGYGLNNSQQISPHNTESFVLPRRIVIDSLPGTVPVGVAAGLSSSYTWLSNGDAYSWGEADSRANLFSLGRELTDKNPCFVPRKIVFPTKVKIKQIVTCDRFTLALTSSGEVYGWGTHFGEQENPKPRLIKTPTKIPHIQADYNYSNSHGTNQQFFSIGTHPTRRSRDKLLGDFLCQVNIPEECLNWEHTNFCIGRKELYFWGSGIGMFFDSTLFGHRLCEREEFLCSMVCVGGEGFLGLSKSGKTYAWGEFSSTCFAHNIPGHTLEAFADSNSLSLFTPKLAFT